MVNKDDFKIDEKLLNKMFTYIRMEEANNLKTSKLTDQQMVNKIVQIIDAILKENDNEISKN